MSLPTFESNRLDELPVHMAGPIGRALASALGQAQDAELALLREAALSRWPFWCPNDALDATGTWFRLPRFQGEVNGTAPTQVGGDDGTGYRGRLCAAWPTWKRAGTKSAIVKSLNAWGLPAVRVENDYEAVPAFPGAWWSRFRVRIGPSFGAFGWGSGNDPTASQQHQMIRQVLFWKWVHGYPVEILLDDGAGYTFPITVGPVLGYNFVWAQSKFGGFNTL